MELALAALGVDPQLRGVRAHVGEGDPGRLLHPVAELAGQQLVRTTQTNETGFFDLQTLPRGVYVVKVEIAGFQTQIQRDVEVTAGGARSLHSFRTGLLRGGERL